MSESIWKKEIHLRKPKEPKAPKEPKEKKVEAKAETAESASIWKKELHLRRQPEPLPPLPARLLDRSRVREERPRGTVVVPVVPGHTDPVQRVERWTARVPAPSATTPFPRPAAGEEQDPVALLPRERATVDPAPAVPALPSPPAQFGWPNDQSPAPAPAPAPAPVAETRPEPVTAPEPAPAPVVAAEPEPEIEPVAEEKVPLLKREISFKRKPKIKPEPEPAAAPEPKPAEEKVPLLKREISLKRKPKAKPEPVAKAEPIVAQAAAEPKPAEEKVPLLKRELSFKRKPKAKVEPQPVVAQAVAEPKPAEEKVPLLKREISFKRKPKTSAPKQPRAKRGSSGGHDVTKIVGLRIGSSQLSAAHIRNNGSAEVLGLARMPLDRGVIANGEVRDAEALAKALKEFFSANKLPRRDIRLGVASNRIGIRVLDVPAVDDAKQFENAIRFRAQEVVPIPVTEAVLDHVVIGDAPDQTGVAMRRVLLVFAHRDLITRYVDACRQAGLRLLGIDLDAFALLRAIGPEKADGAARKATVVVAIGQERTMFALSDGEVCDFARVLEWGSGAIDVAIARSLNLTPSQAEPIKRVLNLAGTEPAEGVSPMQYEAARAAAKTETSHLVQELLESLRFYQSREDSLDIAEIVISGGGSQLAGLGEELQRGLGAPVRIADPFERVHFAKKVAPPQEPASLAIAVGLGMEA